MNIKNFFDNVRSSIRTSPSLSDTIKRIVYLYDAKLPGLLRKPERVLTFSYPPPIGIVKLLMRSNSGADNFIHSEVFEHLYYDLGLNFVPRTILDLGANIGMTAVFFKRLYPGSEIVCVEPMPKNLTLLHRNIQLNDLNVTVYEAAVDATDGFTQMDLNQPDYGFKVGGTGLKVPTICIPTILRKTGWISIDLLKIDIEGHENVILKQNCDWLRHVRAICIEIHDDYTKQDLSDLAIRYGFQQPQHLPGNWLLQRN